MANYKMVDADRLDADLASVADSIRAKAGTTGQIAFPDGFKSAVEGIKTGGTVIPDNARLYYIGEAENILDFMGFNFESSAVGTLTE